MADGKPLSGVEMQLALAGLEARMKTVEAGVANFRQFQADMRDSISEIKDFILSHAVREEEKEKKDRHRAAIHFTLLSALITLIVGCAIALFTWILNGHHVVSQTSYERPTITQPADAGIPRQP